jgi:hypothetical protein
MLTPEAEHLPAILALGGGSAKSVTRCTTSTPSSYRRATNACPGKIRISQNILITQTVGGHGHQASPRPRL